MPIPFLSHLSPYQILFHKIRLYSSFKVFGCLCFPYLRPYMKNKLLPHSSPCVFLGYSSSSIGYLCLHADTRRVYTTRHVRFVESNFPFSSPSPSHVSPSSSSSFTPTLAFPFTQSFSPSSQSSLSNVPFSQSSSPPPIFLPNGSPSTIPPIIPVPFTQSSSNSSTSIAPTNVHPMVTRSKSGALKSKSFLSSLSVDPQTVTQALQYPD